MARQGIYDTEGQIFGYLERDRIYNLASVQMGEVRREGKRRVIYTMSGEKIWYLSGDGIYTLDWEPVGYLGSPYRDSEEYDY